MKYLICLVALLLLCLSPNPSFAQPNRFKQLKAQPNSFKAVANYKSEEFWAFDNYKTVLASIDELFFDEEPRQFEREELTTEQKEALIPKYEEFVKGLIKENPKIVEEFIHEIKQFKVFFGALPDVAFAFAQGIGRLFKPDFKLEHKPEERKKYDHTIDYLLRTLLRSLAVTIPYSRYLSLQDKVHLDKLKLDEVELMKRTRQRLFDLGWKDFEGESLDKFGFQLTKSESPNKRTSSPESPNKSRSSSKSPERSQRTISPQ